MQAEQLLSQRKVSKREWKVAVSQPSKLSKARKHDGNLIRWRGNQEARKSLKVRMATILANDTLGKQPMVIEVTDQLLREVYPPLVLGAQMEIPDLHSQFLLHSKRCEGELSPDNP